MALRTAVASLVAGDITNSHLAGSINATKLAGSIPVGKMDLSGTWNFTGTLQKSGTAVAAYTYDTETFTGDGSATTFDLAAASPVMYCVFIDGIQQSETTNYTYNATGGSGGVARITMSAAPANGAKIDVLVAYSA